MCVLLLPLEVQSFSKCISTPRGRWEVQTLNFCCLCVPGTCHVSSSPPSIFPPASSALILLAPPAQCRCCSQAPLTFPLFTPELPVCVYPVSTWLYGLLFVWQVSRAFYLRYLHTVVTAREREGKNGKKCTHTHTVSEKQHNVSSPLQRDVLLIGLSLVTVWEDELSQRFLPGVVAAAPLFGE